MSTTEETTIPKLAITKAQLANLLPAAGAKPMTSNAIAKALEVPLADLKKWLPAAAEAGLVAADGTGWTLAPVAEAKAAAAAKADGGIVRSVSTAVKEGTAVCSVDGKTYPLTKFPTYYGKDADGNRVTLRHTYTRANRAVAREQAAAAKDAAATEATKAKAEKAKAKKATTKAARKPAAASKVVPNPDAA